MTSSMGAKLGEGEVAPAAAQVKSQLLAQLDSLVQQCESRFSNRYELATEYDSTVASLCQSLETILCHGFRRQPPPRTQASSKLKILNGFSSSSLSSSKSASASSASSSSSSSLDSHNSSAQLWHFLSQYLTEHEVQRFVSLRNVNTDYGRGRSWLRNALNEHSLEKYLSVILSDDDGLQPTSSSSSHFSKSTSARRKFYHDWALLLDPQQAPLLISITRPLSAVLFALSIDRPDLDVEDASSFAGTKSSPKGGNTSEEARLKPVKKKSSGSGGSSSAASSGVQAALVKSRKKKSTIVTINDEEEDLESSDLENGDMYARSAPVPSFMKLAAAGSSSSDLETHRTPTAIKSKNPSSLLSIADTTTDALKTSTMVLYPLYDNHEGASSPADISGYDSPTPTDTTSESITSSDQQQNQNTQNKQTINPDDCHSPSSSSSSLPVANKRLQEQIDFLQLEKEKILRDNSLLKIQLNKYLAALELLKYNHSRSGETAALSANQQPPKNKEEEDGDSEVEVYERKLVQVSEMHGELVEFNEHLYRVIQQKDSIIGRLRDELVELRGPLPDNDDLLSISSEAATTAVAATSVADQSLSLPLIHVWIPTAFLSGGFKGKSHHIYQIYLRIRDEEWNVYRRYSQFYALHKGLKARHPTVGGFEFPPKKALGNKDSKVVQERRKKLETYLRNVLNYLQTTAASTGGDHISSKERLIAAVPFLSDKFFLQDRSHSVSDTNLNASSSVGGGGHSRSNTQSTVQQAPQSQHYMGF